MLAPMSVDPTRETIRRFHEDDDGGPVVMLNLLRFAGEDGRASYTRYAARVAPFLESVGATVLHAGEYSTSLVPDEDPDWDAILVVRYPSRAAFMAMVGYPAYQEITELRTVGLEAAVLRATVPWA
jgi:uncharacterized protein (DUF1330 family)